MSSPCYIPQFFVGLSSLPRLVLRKGTMAASGGYPFDLSWDIAMLGVLVDPMRNQVENHLYAWLKQHLTGLTPNRQEAEISNVTCHFYIFLYLGVLYVFGSGARSTSPAYNSPETTKSVRVGKRPSRFWWGIILPRPQKLITCLEAWSSWASEAPLMKYWIGKMKLLFHAPSTQHPRFPVKQFTWQKLLWLLFFIEWS